MTSLTNAELVEKARKGFATGKTRPAKFRRTQLEKLKKFMDDCQEEIIEAGHKDLRKSRHEAMLYEIETSRHEIVDMLDNLDSYVRPDMLPLNLLAFLDSGYIMPEPYGVVLIMGTWNYPVYLNIVPLIGAIAAGNVAILKPSEVAPNTSAVLAKRLPQYLDPECFFVVEGDVERTKDLLTHKFDYIFATGSTNVGRAVAVAAAQHLTPTTLELGGKSPCFIHESSDFKLAAKRILWAKFINLGQTCIAPDYILCSRNAEKEFLRVTGEVLKEWYGTSGDLQSNPDLPRIINERHFKRLDSILKATKGNVVYGGKTDAKDLWIEPTIVSDVTLSDSLMQEEIFGPILPILTVNSADEAIRQILDTKAKPLAMYVFSREESIIKQVLERISSGSVCVNDCVWQCAWAGLPFGGVGDSGMGAYHGKFSFDTFSHKKAILQRGFSYVSEKLGESRYPPYNQTKLDIFKMIMYNFQHFNVNSPRVISFFGVTIFAILLGVYFKFF